MVHICVFSARWLIIGFRAIILLRLALRLSPLHRWVEVLLLLAVVSFLPTLCLPLGLAAPWRLRGPGWEGVKGQNRDHCQLLLSTITLSHTLLADVWNDCPTHDYPVRGRLLISY